jgi:hypothetical protein
MGCKWWAAEARSGGSVWTSLPNDNPSFARQVSQELLVRALDGSADAGDVDPGVLAEGLSALRGGWPLKRCAPATQAAPESNGTLLALFSTQDRTSVPYWARRVLDAVPASFEEMLAALDASSNQAVRAALREKQRLVQRDLITSRTEALVEHLVKWVLEVRLGWTDLPLLLRDRLATAVRATPHPASGPKPERRGRPSALGPLQQAFGGPQRPCGR